MFPHQYRFRYRILRSAIASTTSPSPGEGGWEGTGEGTGVRVRAGRKLPSTRAPRPPPLRPPAALRDRRAALRLPGPRAVPAPAHPARAADAADGRLSD